MNGIASSAHSSLSLPAVSNASWRDSTTHGPAITNKGCSSPAWKSHSFIVGTSAKRRSRHLASGDVLEPVRGHELARQGGGFDWSVAQNTLAASPCPMLDACADECRKQGMPGARRRGELRMELTCDKPRMIGQLDHLAQVLVRRNSRYAHACIHEMRNVPVVDFITMTVALHDLFSAIDLARYAAGQQRAFLSAEAHRTAEVRGGIAVFRPAVAPVPVMNQCNDGVSSVLVELGSVRTLQ